MEQLRRPSSNSDDDKHRLQVLVGEPWPNGITVKIDEKQEKPREVAVLVSMSFAILLTVFTIYGMVKANQQMLDDVFRLVQYGVVASVSYAFGRSPPPFQAEVK